MLDTALMLAEVSFEMKRNAGGGLLFGIICAVLAPGRGRSALAWFFLGLFFSCIALIVLLLIPDLKVTAAQEASSKKELHRLREQVKKERQVADERHEVHRTRLDAHDRAIGIDTGIQHSGQLSEAQPENVAQPLPPPALPPGQEAQWYFLEERDQLGPVSTSQLRQMWRDVRIDPNTLVWREGMTDWMRYGDLPELS